MKGVPVRLHCQDELTLSSKEIDRLMLVSQIEQEKILVLEAANLLGLSQRQIYQISCAILLSITSCTSSGKPVKKSRPVNSSMLLTLVI